MSLMIGAVVIVIIVAGAAFFMSGKSGAKNTAQSETQEKKGSEGKETAVVQEKAESADKSQSAEAREKKAKTESVLENDKEKGTGENTEKIISENQKVKNEEKVDFKEKNRQKEQLYYYINHELQTLFAAYNKGEWNRLEKLGDMSSALYKEKESIIEGLPSFTGTMVKEYFSCIDFKEEEEKAVCYVKDKEQLKKAFLQFMMPFYPYYYKEDYKEQFGDSYLYEDGNLVMCLSMIESYYKRIEITPDMFLINHNDLCEKGTESLNSAKIQQFIEDIGLGCVEADYDLKTASDSLKTLHGCILVYIPHNSVYGVGGSYLLITGISDTEFIVHDPSN